MSGKNHGARLDRLALVWSRPCPGCADRATYVTVTPEQGEALAVESEVNGSDLPARRCLACGRRLDEQTFTTVDPTRV